jgi:hypothetical protein
MILNNITDNSVKIKEKVSILLIPLYIMQVLIWPWHKKYLDILANPISKTTALSTKILAHIRQNTLHVLQFQNLP